MEGACPLLSAGGDDVANVCRSAMSWVQGAAGFDEPFKFGCKVSQFLLTRPNVDEFLSEND